LKRDVRSTDLTRASRASKTGQIAPVLAVPVA
jgi:hypothetical protein